MPNQLLILDLDETLVYSTECSLQHPCDFTVGPFYVYKRPHLAHFLATCSRLFEFAIWTSASRDYADGIVTELFSRHEVAFVWTRERCTPHRDPNSGKFEWLKDLAKIKRRGYPLERVLIIDDKPQALVRNYGNQVAVHPYLGDPWDNELSLLSAYLPTLNGVEDVRTIEKRQWRNRVPYQKPDEATKRSGS